MESLPATIDTAIRNNDYGTLSRVFSSYGASSWQSLGQGEQRSLAAHFVKSAVAESSGTFLPKAFGSAEMMRVMTEALGHLPSTVEGAADNKLRQLIFEYKVNAESDYAVAARILAGMRMEDDEDNVYYTNPAAKCDGTYPQNSMYAE
jgi:hypothetical protein